MKIPCKLCEMTLDEQNHSCGHKPMSFDHSNPWFVPGFGNMRQVPFQNSGFMLPQVKDIALSYLLRGKLEYLCVRQTTTYYLLM